MTTENFCFWLKGLLDSGITISPRQYDEIKLNLAAVFKAQLIFPPMPSTVPKSRWGEDEDTVPGVD